MKYTVVFLLAVLSFAVYGCFGDSSGDGVPSILILPKYHDFGNVSVSGGEVSTTFVIENRGTGTLIIEKLDTSCGCTTATVTYNGKESPRFTMEGHGTNPKRWKLKIPPGGEALLKVYYNPKVHPDFRGVAMRYVSVYTNDPENPVVKVYIRVVQTD